jgi:nucleoside-diphosphate-sugar epimerase
MSKRLLITGASGFLGYHLVEEALAQGYTVFAAVRKSSKVDHLKDLPIHYTQLDYTNVPSLVSNIEENQYDYIIHAAGTLKAKDLEAYNQVNAVYTKNLALAAMQSNKKIDKFVFVSSLAALGPAFDADSFIEENAVPAPLTNYGKSKLLAERFLADIPDLPLIILRPTAVYGPREKDIFLMFEALNRGLELYIGHVKQKLSFIYVTDAAKITVQALTSPVKRGIYNVSDGKAYDRYELAKVFKQESKVKTLKLHLPLAIVKTLAYVLEKVYAWRGETPALNGDKLAELIAPNWSCSNKKLKEELGFVPRYELDAGVRETYRWYKANGWL